MVLVMFTPGLACAKYMNHHPAPVTSMEKGMPCCPEQKTPDCGATFFKDCMKVDLQHLDSAAVLKKQDLMKQDYSLTTLPSLQQPAAIAEANTARGPPFTRSLGIAPVNIPIFLATQRLRI